MESKFRHGTIQRMKFSDGSGEGFGGQVRVPSLLTAKIRLRPNTDKRSDASPDYWIETPTIDPSNGETYWGEAGAAWVKTPAAGGDEFISLNVDIASQPRAVSLAAFLADKEDQPKAGEGGELWRLNYSRPRRGAGSAPAQSSNPLPNDSIEF